jgi:hypothetical protein
METLTIKMKCNVKDQFKKTNYGRKVCQKKKIMGEKNKIININKRTKSREKRCKTHAKKLTYPISMFFTPIGVELWIQNHHCGTMDNSKFSIQSVWNYRFRIIIYTKI